MDVLDRLLEETTAQRYQEQEEYKRMIEDLHNLQQQIAQKRDVLIALESRMQTLQELINGGNNNAAE